MSETWSSDYPAQLAWFQGKVPHAGLEGDYADFVLKELKLNPNGAGFTASEEHIKGSKGSQFRSRLNRRLKDLHLTWGDRKLEGIYLKGDHLDFKWESSSSPADQPLYVDSGDNCNYEYFDQLMREIQPGALKKAVFIQHWGQSSDHVRNELLKNTEAKIELYLQTPGFACCRYQNWKINLFIDEFMRHAQSPENKKLFTERVTLFCYDTHASVRGFTLDDRALALSWYIYWPRGETDREVDISGRHLPTIYVKNDSPSFARLKYVFDQWVKKVRGSCRQIFPVTDPPQWPIPEWEAKKNSPSSTPVVPKSDHGRDAPVSEPDAGKKPGRHGRVDRATVSHRAKTRRTPALRKKPCGKLPQQSKKPRPRRRPN